MRKFFLSLITIFAIFGGLSSATAQVIDGKLSMRAVIDANDTVQVNKNIIFDATQSYIPDKTIPVRYEWDFADGSPKESGAEVVHSYKKPGEYLITLTLYQGEEKASISRDLFAYEKLVLFLTDVTERKESIDNLAQKALEEGTYINMIESYDSTSAYISEETLSKKLADQVNVIGSADSIVVWTTRGSGINALTRLVRERPEIQDFLNGKTIVVISDKNLNTLGRIMQGNFDIIKPKQIVLTREYELRNLIRSPSVDVFLKDLQSGITESRIIDAKTHRIGPWNFISYLVNFMIARGVPSNTIVLLLMLPVIATIIAFLKQVVGVTTFGLYTPAVVTLSFLALGLKFGLIIFIIIVVTGALVRKALERVRLMHIPRVAIVFTISTLIILFTLACATYLGVHELASVAVFPMLIMTTLAEKFVNAQSGKGVVAALLLILETVVVSLICYWFVEWQYIQNLMLSYPEIILLLILFNWGLGSWTGLRFFEYIRFREVMKHTEE